MKGLMLNTSPADWPVPDTGHNTPVQNQLLDNGGVEIVPELVERIPVMAES